MDYLVNVTNAQYSINGTYAVAPCSSINISAVDEIRWLLADIDRRLRILEHDAHLESKYPALKEAHDAYTAIRKLVDN